MVVVARALLLFALLRGGTVWRCCLVVVVVAYGGGGVWRGGVCTCASSTHLMAKHAALGQQVRTMRLVQMGVGRSIRPIARAPTAVASLGLHRLAGIPFLCPEVTCLTKAAIVVAVPIIIPVGTVVVDPKIWLELSFAH